ncbi:hypothetical protein CO666_15645 [Rhizobium chutanense]|uniref:Uncharacterized protein n=1 Tax=Rhizobium chutanense TaxID=2035448 RepID=A0A2A6JC43_9HYPH|nr:hypothetical protein CO666_15645 [Rhizobium chutanense]
MSRNLIILYGIFIGSIPVMGAAIYIFELGDTPTIIIITAYSIFAYSLGGDRLISNLQKRKNKRER